MNDITTKSMSVNSDLPQATFERVRQEPNKLWKKIHESDFFRNVFQAVVGTFVAVTFTSVILPASLLLAAISLVGLITLGLSSPALLHPTSAKVWRTVKNKILGLLTDLLCLPNAVLITPLAFKPNVSIKQNEGNNPLVVFVHGFLHNKTCWESLANKLCQDTKDTDHSITQKDIYAINLGEPLTIEEIDHYARFLATKLEKIRIKRNLEKLDVVLDGHSMGGLVSAHFATTYASLVGVNVIILISNGTPWHGTLMAHLGSLTSCGKEMLPNHASQTELAGKIENIRDLVFTIASKGDTIVPYDSARGSELKIDETHRFTLDQPFGHLAMQYSEQGQTLNVKLITEGIALYQNLVAF